MIVVLLVVAATPFIKSFDITEVVKVDPDITVANGDELLPSFTASIGIQLITIGVEATESPHSFVPATVYDPVSVGI